MDNEATRILNEEETPNEQVITTESKTKSNPTAKKSNKTASRVAAAAGAGVAGVALGAVATAKANETSDDLPEPNETEETADSVETPEPGQTILANDEGIRYAHVEADSFDEAFAQAREQVGPGGVFEYEGRLYGTYTADEWSSMSADEKADYQSRVNEVAPTHHQPAAHAAYASHVADQPAPEPMMHATAEPTAVHQETIVAEPADSEIRVLGVEAVQIPNGQIMNVALVENDGDQALLVDVDNNGSIDVLLHDDNSDGAIQETEVYDVSDAGLGVADLLQAQTAQENNLYYASADDMPDFVDPADQSMPV